MDIQDDHICSNDWQCPNCKNWFCSCQLEEVSTFDSSTKLACPNCGTTMAQVMITVTQFFENFSLN